MKKIKKTSIKGHPFKNVAVSEDVHEKLRQISEHERRSMSQQLSVMIIEAHKALQEAA